MAKSLNGYLIPVLSLIFIITPDSSVAKLERKEETVKEDGSLSILVLGDWGRKGAYNQSKVAYQMGKIGAELNVDFIISTGDNFYETGLNGVLDPAFLESFSDIYTAPSLQKQWYSVLGNHDYRGDVEAQLSPELRLLDRRWFCQRSFIVGTEIADFFFVDTSPFIDNYFDGSKWKDYDWRGVIPRKNYLTNLLQDVDSALKDSNAYWKIVVGHHPIKSVGHHGNTKEIESQLLPILQENKVDLYMNGHDHCLEHISDSISGIQFMTSGGGSKAWKGETSFSENNKKDLKLFYDGQGFLSLLINKGNVQVNFYDVFGRIIHRWSSVKGMHYTF